MLPAMKIHVGRSKAQQLTFGGYDHNPTVGEGRLYDMENLSGDCYPALSPRRGRTLAATLTKPNGLFSHGALCWADGDGFYYGGKRVGTVADGEKRFAALGPYILIFPDKAYYNTAKGEFGQLELRWTGSASFTNYVWDAEGAGEETYQGNAVHTSGTPFPFEAGEAVEISGSSAAENNRTPVILDVVDGGRTLVFSNNLFTERSAQTLTLARTVPDMDFFCENENRLWGCKGSEIYACALGNPFRWKNYEGLATDSYAVSVGSPGDFTGAASFLGYPIFFKADAIYKVYGSKPSNFQVMSSAVGGVRSGGAGTAAVAGETLFYLSRTGMSAYTGGLPSSLAAPFGEARFVSGCGGSDGRRYYACLYKAGEPEGTVFCHDPRTGLWYKEDRLAGRWFAEEDGTAYLLCGDGRLWSLGTGETAEVSWFAETGDFTDNGPDKAWTVRLQLRAELDPSSTLEVAVQFDSSGVWETVRRITGGGKRSVLLPIVPRRCDHYRLRLSGTGGCRVFGLTREYVRGSAL